MIRLHGKLELLSSPSAGSLVLSLTKNESLPRALVNSKGLLCNDRDNYAADGFKVIFHNKRSENLYVEATHFFLTDDMLYLDEGDVIRVNLSDGSFRVLFRKGSRHNSILLTEQCNHYCLMCSQPPKNVDDSWILDEARHLIKLIPRDTFEIGFTGGEPTLYGDQFINLLQLTKNYLPNTVIHILSNGRAFKDIDYARKYAGVQHHDMMVGIPIYSDDSVRHDYVVQSKNAFNETIRGILNLKSLNQKVEIRVVIHKQTIGRLVQLCEFIARNLLFVDHIALMGLEITGFTRSNLSALWIDPFEYKDTLSQAVHLLESYGMNVSVYNHQRCVVNDDILKAYRKSISDWKNEYLDECERLGIKYELGGKAPEDELSAFPPKYDAIDCSGWIRAAIAYATDGLIVIPDGSENQHDWFASHDFKPTNYENTALRDNRLRVAFLFPDDTSERVGHVWFIRNGKTLESHGGTGPSSRYWNTPILMHCHAAFVVE